MQPDIQALALTKAIRQKESGGNYSAVGDVGTSTGAYQYQAGTWKDYSKQVLGVDNAPMTPENQNAVTYGMVKKWKDSGLGPAEIAAKWNSGQNTGWENKIGTTTINGKPVQYNVPQYVSEVVSNFKQIYPQEQAKFGQSVQTTEQPQETYNALFPASSTDNPLTAGLKAVGNVPSSLFNFGKSIVQAVTNPIDTVKGVGNVIIGGAEKLTGSQPTESTQTFDAFVGALKDRYGSLENLQRTATNDPFGFGADILSVVEGGAGLVGKTKQLNTGLSRVAQTVTEPIAKPVQVATDVAKKTTSFGFSQLTGLNKETISELLKNPSTYKNVNPEIRVETAQKVADAVNTRLDELSDVGKGYETIRNTPEVVKVSPTYLDNMIKNQGVSITKGKLSPTTSGAIRDTRDINALQNLYDLWSPSFKSGQISNTELLNFREDLSKLSKFGRDIGKSDALETWARSTRSDLNDRYGVQVKGLRELDAQYAPERELLGRLKKDIFDAKGELKDGAISKIANLTGKGKEQLLERVKQVVPDIEQRVKIIKTVEDIERASNFKTGAYIRGTVVSGGALTGNVPAIIAAIISQPEIAVPLLRGAGYVGQKALPILEAVKAIANDINNFRLPPSLITETLPD